MKKNKPALGKKYRILASPHEWQQVCNQSNPEKPVEVVKGADFSRLGSKVLPNPAPPLVNFPTLKKRSAVVKRLRAIKIKKPFCPIPLGNCGAGVGVLSNCDMCCSNNSSPRDDLAGPPGPALFVPKD
jgi:hypothetical protein